MKDKIAISPHFFDRNDVQWEFSMMDDSRRELF